MLGRKQLVPKSFDAFIIEHSVPGMPGEHAFCFSLVFNYGGEVHRWERVWVITDLATEFADIDIAADPLATLQREREHQVHRFRVDVIRYLRCHNPNLNKVH